MSETAVDRRSPLHGLALPTRAGLVAVVAAEPVARFVFRGAPEAIGDAFGVSLPTVPMRAAEAGSRAALWLGPDEWLLLAPAAETDALVSRLAVALSGKPSSLVDVGHRNAGLVASGPQAAWLLASGCPLDFDPAAFPAGTVARTLYAKAEVVLWRRGVETFHVEVQRSYAPYLAACLTEAARDVR